MSQPELLTSSYKDSYILAFNEKWYLNRWAVPHIKLPFTRKSSVVGFGKVLLMQSSFSTIELIKVWSGCWRERVNKFLLQSLFWARQDWHMVLHFTDRRGSTAFIFLGDRRKSKTFWSSKMEEKDFLVALFCHNKRSKSCTIKAT